jgi:hypothetical protein
MVAFGSHGAFYYYYSDGNQVVLFINNNNNSNKNMLALIDPMFLGEEYFYIPMKDGGGAGATSEDTVTLTDFVGFSSRTTITSHHNDDVPPCW